MKYPVDQKFKQHLVELIMVLYWFYSEVEKKIYKFTHLYPFSQEGANKKKSHSSFINSTIGSNKFSIYTFDLLIYCIPFETICRNGLEQDSGAMMVLEH
jgi:hypothetical protein